MFFSPLIPTACSISGMDLFFVLDESGSVGSTNYDRMKTFVNQWIDGLDIGENDVRVGLMAYGSFPRVHFYLNRYYDKADMKEAVSKIGYGGGGTNTARALDTIRLNAFTEANGGRPISAGVARVVVVVTDGRSNSFSNTMRAATELHNQKIIVFAIGISGANEAELNVIASRPSYAEFISTFNLVRLNALQAQASETVCTGIAIWPLVHMTVYCVSHIIASPEVPINEPVMDTID